MTLYIGNDEISKKIILENISGGGIDLPEISEITKGKILGNDGSTLSWVDESDYIASEFNQTLNMSYITNCITKIPQDIKLELSDDGTLTLKAGSKVYVPNGDGVFDEVIVPSDISTTTVWNRNGINMLFYNPSNKIDSIGIAYTNSDIWSGSNPVIDKQYGFWYDTTNNRIKYTTNNGSSWISGFSLPICVVFSDNEVISSIDQVFNGFGYIGSTIFALPGVEGLIPNGRNVDGSFKNVKYTTTNVLIATITDNSTFSAPVIINGENSINTPNYSVRDIFYQNNQPTKAGSWYDTANNFWYYSTNGTTWVKQSIYLFLSYMISFTEGKVTSFNPKTVFQSIDRNDTEWASTASKPSSRYIDLALGADNSKYKAPANGTFVVGKRAGAAGQFINMTVLDADDNVICPFWSDSSAGGVGNICGHRIQVKKGQQIRIGYNVTGEGVVFRFIYDEGAK